MPKSAGFVESSISTSMDKTAIRQAWERLHRAQSAYTSLIRSRSFTEAERAWSSFLTSAAGVYSKLEKGAKGNPRSEPWFGRLKNERRSDELLRYVHHARNSDEHGISEITTRHGGSLSIGDPGETVTTGPLIIDENGNVQVELNPKAPRPTIRFQPGSIALAAVSDDRFGDTFAAPTVHLGKPLQTGSVVEVAGLAVQYLERIVREASELSK